MLNKQAAKSDSSPLLLWWLKGQDRQNFGDFLTEFLWDNLAEEARIQADVYRLIGSAIDDWIIQDDLTTIGKWDDGRIAFWCCGMRDDNTIGAESLARSVFCGVRGPLTRDRLNLPSATPIGDPALLLPLFHTPKVSEKTKGRVVCSPHFLDASSDRELLESTGAELIVRPSIANSRDEIVAILSDLASAEFVLAGSLHAAIVACAYNVPFCYLDRGRVDIPFKWRDFSASINIGTFFVDNAAQGKSVFEGAIKPRLHRPLLFPILAAAPFRARPEQLLNAALHDAAQLTAGARIDRDAFAAFINLANQDIAAVGAEAHRLTLIDLSARLGEATAAHHATLRALDQEREAVEDAETRAAERGRERDAARAALAEAEARAADRVRERDNAISMAAKADRRAKQLLTQRDGARRDTDFLARYLSRTYQRPWRPIKHLINSQSLKVLGNFVAPFDKRMSTRFNGSAQKRSANRFERFLAKPALSPEAKTRRETGNFNILYFSPFPSHPANHGNQARIQHLARRFQSLGHKVHFALLESPIYDTETERAMREAWDTFDILPNQKALWANGSEIPFDGWYEDGLGEEVRFLCEICDIDVVFCSYVFQSKLLEFVPPHILKVIDTHDKMGGRYDMLRTHGQLLEFFSCSPEEEGAYLRRADVVVAVREEEARYFDSVTGRNTAIVIPHVEDPRYVDKRFNDLANIGIVASANRINLTIVLEFLQTLSRQCRGACPFTVHIAGQVRDMVKDLRPEEAQAFSALWVRMLGFVPDIAAFYRDMDVVVSPVTMGTGINIKTVQAMAYGMPVVTTECGSKGIATDEPMHNYSNVDSLVHDLLGLAKHPEELNHLAAISRARYDNFLADAMASIRTMFSHQKLSGQETRVNGKEPN